MHVGEAEVGMIGEGNGIESQKRDLASGAQIPFFL